LNIFRYTICFGTIYEIFKGKIRYCLNNCVIIPFPFDLWDLPKADMQRNSTSHSCITALNVHDFQREKVDFLSNKDMVQVMSKINSGSWGAIYKCTFTPPNGKALQCTAKLARKLIENRQIRFTRDGKIRIVINSRTGTIANYKDWKTNFKNFNKEFIMGEYVQDPPSLRKLDEYRQRIHGGMQITQEITEAIKRTIEEERVILQSHPGFHHLLRLIHFIPEIPCIIAEECSGDSLDLFANGTLSHEPLSHTYITHVILAMLYLYQVCGIANTDLKFENVLYKRQTGGKYTFIVCDYGGCKYANEKFQQKRTTITEPYFIHSNWDLGHVKIMSISIFNLLVMIFYIYLKRCLLANGESGNSPFNREPCETILMIPKIEDMIDKLHQDNTLRKIRGIIVGMPSTGYNWEMLMVYLVYLGVCDTKQILAIYHQTWLNHHEEIEDHNLRKTLHRFTPKIQYHQNRPPIQPPSPQEHAIAPQHSHSIEYGSQSIEDGSHGGFTLAAACICS